MRTTQQFQWNVRTLERSNSNTKKSKPPKNVSNLANSKRPLKNKHQRSRSQIQKIADPDPNPTIHLDPISKSDVDFRHISKHGSGSKAKSQAEIQSWANKTGPKLESISSCFHRHLHLHRHRRWTWCTVRCRWIRSQRSKTPDPRTKGYRHRRNRRNICHRTRSETTSEQPQHLQTTSTPKSAALSPFTCAITRDPKHRRHKGSEPGSQTRFGSPQIWVPHLQSSSLRIERTWS